VLEQFFSYLSRSSSNLCSVSVPNNHFFAPLVQNHIQTVPAKKPSPNGQIHSKLIILPPLKLYVSKVSSNCVCSRIIFWYVSTLAWYNRNALILSPLFLPYILPSEVALGGKRFQAAVSLE